MHLGQPWDPRGDPQGRGERIQEDKPGVVHVDLKALSQMHDEEARRDWLVAMDWATRWVELEIHPEKSAADAKGFLEHLLQAAPFTVTTVLTDNGRAFTKHLNGLIAKVLATRRFSSGEHLEDILNTLCQPLQWPHPEYGLGHLSPVQALQDW